MKELMKGFSDSSAILKEWGVIGLLKGYCGVVYRKAFSRLIVEEVDSVNNCLKKFLDVGQVGEWCLIRMNARGLRGKVMTRT